MTPADWAVVFSGLATIAWINWYFFLAERATAVAVAGVGGVQEVTIAVRSGYDPADVRVKAGVPVRLVFDRQETSGCSEEIVLPEFGIKRFLPAHRKTPVEFTPEKAGTYEFTCGMSMLRGRLTVVGEPVSGDVVLGEPMLDEPVVGEPVVGEPVSGEPTRDEKEA